MKIIDGSVVVRPLRDNDEIILKSGHKIYVPLVMPHTEGLIHTKTDCVAGVVLSVPERVPWEGWEDDSIQVQIGDTIIYHFLPSQAKESMGDGIRVPYVRIFAVIRDNEIIPINGWLLCRPEEQKYDSSIYVPKTGRKKYTQKVVVVYASKPTKRYTATQNGEEFYVRDTDYPPINPGAVIYVEKNSDVFLENDVEQILGEPLFRVQRRQIIAIE